MSTLTNDIKQYALQLGFCKVGVTTAAPFERGVPEARARGGYDCWLERFEKGSDPASLLPEAKSVIVLAYDYANCHFPDSLTAMIGRTYLSRAYLPQRGTPMDLRLRAFETFLTERGIRFVPDQNMLLMRPAAQRAGVASFGRNSFAYVDGVGSFVLLYGYVVDRELVYDKPAPESKCPPGCRACIDACPTGALTGPFCLDPTRCVAYNNWMYKGGAFGHTVPSRLRKGLGCHIHGCDVCQEVCPLNKRALTAAQPEDTLLEEIAEKFSLADLLHMPDGFFETCVQPIMYKDRVYFQRNAAIAIGNTGDRAYIPHLIRELSHPHEAVRLHVVWALGEMDDPTGTEALRAHMEQEASPAVLEEIRSILSRKER